jgi:hypothetical protein
MIRSLGPELLCYRVDLFAKLVDESKRRPDVAPPRLGELQTLEQLTSADTEEIRHRAGMAEGHQACVDPVLQGTAVFHQMKPKARPFPLGPYLRVTQPDGRDGYTLGLGKTPDDSSNVTNLNGTSLGAVVLRPLLVGYQRLHREDLLAVFEVPRGAPGTIRPTRIRRSVPPSVGTHVTVEQKSWSAPESSFQHPQAATSIIAA